MLVRSEECVVGRQIQSLTQELSYKINFLYVYSSNFQPFSSQGIHKLLTKILRHTEIYIFTNLTKKVVIILIHSHQTAIVVLTVVIFSLTA